MVDATGYGELRLQVRCRGAQQPRKGLERGRVVPLQLRPRKGSNLAQDLPGSLHTAEPLDKAAECALGCLALIGRAEDFPSDHLAPFLLLSEAQVREALPCVQILGSGSERAHVRKRCSCAPNGRRYLLASESEMIRADARETCTNTRAQGARVMREHVWQPMAPQLQHPLEQLLHFAPVVIQAIEHQVGVRRQRDIAFGIDQCTTRRTPIEV